MENNKVKYTGGCHCGAVRFEVFSTPVLDVIDCNCSICVKKHNLHFIVPLDAFKIVKGHDSLKTYTFNTHQAKHIFCITCGVQSFYIPRSNPDGYGVAVGCLDNASTVKTKVQKFDGKNWESSMAKNSHIKDFSKSTNKK